MKVKKILAVLVSAVLLFVTLPFGIFTASAETEGYYTYTVSNGEATITDCNIAISGEVAIPSTLGGYPVTNIGSSAFYNCAKIKNITIPNSITKIGANAFQYCFSLSSVTIGNGVIGIESSAFYNCSSLTSIIIPNSVTTIGYSAFERCTKLTDVTLSDSITSIGSQAFSGCINLNKLIIAQGSTRITSTMVICATQLTEIVIPDGVTNIEDRTFYNCENLISITIPDGVISIGNLAFYNCSSLTSIIIPESIMSVGNDAFFNSYLLNDVYYSGSKSDRTQIYIGSYNDCFTDCIWHYNYCCHSYNESVTIPTCTQKGYTTYTCNKCGDCYVSDEVPSIGHNFSDWIVRTDITCETDGEEYRTCSNCNKEEIRTISASGHTHIAITTLPTCTENGYTTHTCHCGDSYIDNEVTAQGHNFSDWTIRTNADCETDGEKYRICSVCKYEETALISAHGHSFAETFDIYKEATEFEEGLKYRICTNLCGAVTDETVIPKTSIADGICGEDAKWAVREDGTLLLAGNGATDNYKLPSYAPWSEYSNIISQIIIPETISKIGNNNFGNFTALSKVVIENPHCSFGLWVFPENTSNFAIYCMGGASVEEYTKNNNIILIKPECPNIPIAPILKYRTESSVELEKIEGYEYSIDGVNWQTDSIFNNLSSGKSYTFYQRIAENVYAPSYNSESLIVTTLSKTQPPIIMSAVKNTVTLQYESGYEYSTDGVNWQSSNIFTKISYDTLICFYQRKSASGTDGATSASEPTKCIIASAPKVLVGQSSIKVVAKPNYEYCIDDMVWQDSNVFTKYIIPNETYTVYQRPKAQDGVEIFYDTNGVSVCVNGEDIIKTPNSTHLVWLRKMLLLNDNCYSIAADFNNDGEVNIIDLVRLKKTLASQLTVVYDRQYSVYVPNTDDSNEIDLYLCTINFTSNGLCEFGQGEYTLMETKSEETEVFDTIIYNNQDYGLIGGTGGDCEFTVTNEEIIVSDEWKELRLEYDTNNNLVITYISGDFENWFGFKVGTVFN